MSHWVRLLFTAGVSTPTQDSNSLTGFWKEQGERGHTVPQRSLPVTDGAQMVVLPSGKPATAKHVSFKWQKSKCATDPLTPTC